MNHPDHRPFPNAEPQFGLPGCTCRPYTRQGDRARYLVGDESVQLISGWEMRGDCPYHGRAASDKPENEPERLSDLVGRELLIQARIEALKIADRRTPRLPVESELVDLARQYEEWILRESPQG